jgi:hypothetical protein
MFTKILPMQLIQTDRKQFELIISVGVNIPLYKWLSLQCGNIGEFPELAKISKLSSSVNTNLSVIRFQPYTTR